MVSVQQLKANKERRAPKASRLTKKEEEHIIKQLLSERDRVLRQMILWQEEYSVNVRDSSGDLSSTPSHIADVGTDMMEREYTFQMASSLRRKMTLIDEALQSIYGKKGFGVCKLCGGNIEKKRLKALPYTALCFNCMRTHES
jgi:RNA polymerase-binding transcription factor DksA